MQTNPHSDLTDNELRDRIAKYDAAVLRLQCKDFHSRENTRALAHWREILRDDRAELARREEADASVKVAAQ